MRKTAFLFLEHSKHPVPFFFIQNDSEALTSLKEDGSSRELNSLIAQVAAMKLPTNPLEDDQAEESDNSKSD